MRPSTARRLKAISNSIDPPPLLSGVGGIVRAKQVTDRRFAGPGGRISACRCGAVATALRDTTGTPRAALSRNQLLCLHSQSDKSLRSRRDKAALSSGCEAIGRRQRDRRHARGHWLRVRPFPPRASALRAYDDRQSSRGQGAPSICQLSAEKSVCRAETCRGRIARCHCPHRRGGPDGSAAWLASVDRGPTLAGGA